MIEKAGPDLDHLGDYPGMRSIVAKTWPHRPVREERPQSLGGSRMFVERCIDCGAQDAVEDWRGTEPHLTGSCPSHKDGPTPPKYYLGTKR